MATVEIDRRERLVRTLTFWLRPRFVLRVVNRFQRIVGFDRAMALTSSALTAIIPLAIVTSALASQLGGKETAERIIDRYELTGAGAAAVEDIFSPADASTSLGLIGFVFLLVAVLSFTRAMQRMFEQTWELKPLSVRNSLNGLLWIGGLTLYIGVAGALHARLGASKLDIGGAVVVAPLSFAFLVWSGQTLTAKRLGRGRLVPFAVVASAFLAVYSVGATVYVPHLFNSFSSRYGVIGAVFAMISALFCAMCILVGAAALGREVGDELTRIRRGERPADDQVREQWKQITTEARSRWATLRARRGR